MSRTRRSSRMSGIEPIVVEQVVLNVFQCSWTFSKTSEWWSKVSWTGLHHRFTRASGKGALFPIIRDRAEGAVRRCRDRGRRIARRLRRGGKTRPRSSRKRSAQPFERWGRQCQAPWSAATAQLRRCRLLQLLDNGRSGRQHSGFGRGRSSLSGRWKHSAHREDVHCASRGACARGKLEPGPARRRGGSPSTTRAASTSQAKSGGAWRSHRRRQSRRAERGE